MDSETGSDTSVSKWFRRRQVALVVRNIVSAAASAARLGACIVYLDLAREIPVFVIAVEINLVSRDLESLTS